MIKINKKNISIILFIVLSLTIVGCTTKTYENEYNQSLIEIDNLKQEIEILKMENENIQEFNIFYNKATTEYNQANTNRNDANYNYDLSFWYYEEQDFEETINYCVIAREFYSNSNTNYQKSITYFEQAEKVADEKYIELIDNYIKASDIVIDINWAMYEACEYFESASNFYSKGLYESGNDALEVANEKIVLHDSLVRDYNKYVLKIEVLEEQI